MIVSDLNVKEIKPGLRVKSLVSDRIATVILIDHINDNYAWLLWDGDSKPRDGFFDNDCKCEIIEDESWNTPDLEKIRIQSAIIFLLECLVKRHDNSCDVEYLTF